MSEESEKIAKLEIQLKATQRALQDLLLLIEEHGGQTIRAHATRILKIRSVLIDEDWEDWKVGL